MHLSYVDGTIHTTILSDYITAHKQNNRKNHKQCNNNNTKNNT